MMYKDKSLQPPVEKCYWTENSGYCMVTWETWDQWKHITCNRLIENFEGIYLSFPKLTDNFT